jgi:hypothetical protein
MHVKRREVQHRSVRIAVEVATDKSNKPHKQTNKSHKTRRDNRICSRLSSKAQQMWAGGNTKGWLTPEGLGRRPSKEGSPGIVSALSLLLQASPQVKETSETTKGVTG